MTDHSSLRLERRFAAEPPAVFDALTDPDVLRRWWAVDPDDRTAEVEVDARPGGRYRLTMKSPDGSQRLTVGGEYREVEPPSRLVFTWRWETPDAAPETLVTIELAAREDGTELVLLHEGFVNAEEQAKHEHGWGAVFDTLVARGVLAEARV
jgi:uncharacterized protein YndB with AHSA1/START domain